MADENMPDTGETVQFLSRADYATSGIYFLHFRGEVIYVGKSLNMWARIGQHMTEGKKHFDHVSCRRIKPSELDDWERYFIELLAPTQNQCFLSQQAKAQHSKFGAPVMSPKPLIKRRKQRHRARKVA